MKYKKLIIKIQSFTDETYIVLYLQLTPENKNNYFAPNFTNHSNIGYNNEKNNYEAKY